MPVARLLLDEDVRPLLAEILRSRGFDAIAVSEAKLSGRSDREVLTWATREGRTVLTHNVRDFVALVSALAAHGEPHGGVIVSDQLPLRELLSSRNEP